MSRGSTGIPFWLIISAHLRLPGLLGGTVKGHTRIQQARPGHKTRGCNPDSRPSQPAGGNLSHLRPWQKLPQPPQPLE